MSPISSTAVVSVDVGTILLISIRETSQELDFWSNQQKLDAIIDHWPLKWFKCYENILTAPHVGFCPCDYHQKGSFFNPSFRVPDFEDGQYEITIFFMWEGKKQRQVMESYQQDWTQHLRYGCVSKPRAQQKFTGLLHDEIRKQNYCNTPNPIVFCKKQDCASCFVLVHLKIYSFSQFHVKNRCSRWAPTSYTVLYRYIPINGRK